MPLFTIEKSNIIIYGSDCVAKELLLVTVCAFVLTTFFVPIVKLLAVHIGAVDKPNARKVHHKIMPRMGGLAIYGAFWMVTFTFYPFSQSLMAFFLGATMLIFVGIVDDVTDMPAKLKLLGQIIAACIVTLGGIRIEFVTSMFGDAAMMALHILAVPVSVIWIVAIINAVNLIDGLDGLACGVSTISAISMLVIALLVSESDVALVMASLVGACLGFLPFNRNPAKMFMGDTGSTFLGYILATISIQGLFKYYAIVSFAVPFLILGLPMFDTLFAIIRRLAHGQNPMAPDRGHIHHRLIDMGLNQKQAVAALYVISSILGLSAVVLTSSGAIKAMLFLMALAVAAFLASRVIFRRDIDKALQAEKAAAEEKSTETATPAETVPAEPEEETNEEKKEEA